MTSSNHAQLPQPMLQAVHQVRLPQPRYVDRLRSVPLKNTHEVLVGGADVGAVLVVDVEERPRLLPQRPQVSDTVPKQAPNRAPTHSSAETRDEAVSACARGRARWGDDHQRQRRQEAGESRREEPQDTC